MNFRVASRGVAIHFDFPAGEPCLNCSSKIIFKKISRSLRSLLFVINLLYLVR